jgi:hypothetical protein
MNKPQLPEHSEWQNKLFYIIVALMIYQLVIIAIASIGCSYRHVWRNETITNDKVCLTASQDTKDAIGEYLTLILALISKVPGGDTPKKDPTKPEGEAP